MGLGNCKGISTVSETAKDMSNGRAGAMDNNARRGVNKHAAKGMRKKNTKLITIRRSERRTLLVSYSIKNESDINRMNLEAKWFALLGCSSKPFNVYLKGFH